MTEINKMELIIEAQSQNEGFSRSVVAAFFAQINPTLEQVEDLKTAVSEAVTNCIVHAYGGQQHGKIEICCVLYNSGITVTVTDFGKGIENVEQAMRPFYTTVQTGERSGMGFTVMQAFCDDVNVVSKQGQTAVTLTKNI